MTQWIGQHKGPRAVAGAVLVAWAVARFWRDRVGSRWSRIHHALIAAGCVMLVWVSWCSAWPERR